MQVYVLSHDPDDAAAMLAHYPRRARATNLREGQQILSVCLHERGLPTLYKLDGSRYSGINHRHHRLVRWFTERDERALWLLDHLMELTSKYYYEHYVRLLRYMREEDRAMFFQGNAELDDIPWFPMQEYDGPCDVAQYLEWKYLSKDIR